MARFSRDDMPQARAASTQKRTRIQREKEAQILEAALEVFSSHGFRGATIDQIADAAGLSKPNLLYYFRTKEAIHRLLIDRLLHTWIEPLVAIDPEGDALCEIRDYVHRKLELARDYPRESRLFANEILQGAPRIGEEMQELKDVVDEKVKVIQRWIDEGKLAKCHPYHLIFSIWATTQHYADFDIQVRSVLDEEDRETRFADAAGFLECIFVNGLRPDGAIPSHSGAKQAR